MAEVLETPAEPLFTIELPGAFEVMDDEEFFKFCQANSPIRIERTSTGKISLLAPEGSRSNLGVVTLTELFLVWSRRNGQGTIFSSSAGFLLPNRAMRAPDIAWVRNERLDALSQSEFERFLPLCPDFVLELRSPSDSLKVLQAKMEEYMQNGAELGWLLDPISKKVFVYWPQAPVQAFDNPSEISGEPLLPGFVLDVQYLWDVMARKRRA